MAIDDIIANPTVAPIAQLLNQGIADRAENKMRNLEFLSKKLGYQEDLANVGLNAKKRRLETGAVDFALKNQKGNLQRGQIVRELEDESAADEQYMRGINDPATYERWAKQGRLPATMTGPDGVPLPFEATAKQRAALVNRAIDDAPHVRNKELAMIRSSTGQDGYTAADPTKPQVDAGWELVDQYSRDNKWAIGDLKSTQPSDAKQAVRAVTELPAQIATRVAKQSGKAPNEQELRQMVVETIDKYRIPNPKNKKAWGPLKWQYTDEIVDWKGFNKEINDKFGLAKDYTSPFMGSASVSAPAFMFKGKEITKEQLDSMAENAGMTVDDLIKHYKIEAK